MTVQSFDDLDVRGRRVLMRVDFNVPLDDGRVVDDTRIRSHLPAIRSLRDRDARVVLMSHLGRPKGRPVADLSLRPIAGHLAMLIGAPVAFNGSSTGEDATRLVDGLDDGGVALLENLRFDLREEADDDGFARELAELGDVYVDDAFGAAHRAHASTVGVARLLPAAAGPLLLREVETLTSMLDQPARPFVAIVGGAKVSDKLAVMTHLVGRVDTILVGGGMANTLLLASGREIGRSLAEPDFVEQARTFLDSAAAGGTMVVIPTDVVIAPAIDAGRGRIVPVDTVPADESVFDIGPDTAARYAAEVAGAATVFWNGPMGVAEREPFAAGTVSVAKAVAGCRGETVVGGGDSIAALAAAGLLDRIDHVSTGGGASLELLEGRTLPGLAALGLA